MIESNIVLPQFFSGAMIAENVKIEHTRLLFSFYGKSQVLNLMFALVMFFMLRGQVDTISLYGWLLFALIGLGLQRVLVNQYYDSELLGPSDYSRWHNYAIAASLFLGLAWAATPIFALSLPAQDYFMIIFFLMMKLTVVSASGFKSVFMAGATPLLISIGWSSFVQFESYWYWPFLAILGLFTFYYMGKYFETTLLESIQIRFEKQELLREVESKRIEAEQANRAKSVFLASASHDLRQPLHALGLYLDMLRETSDMDEKQVLEAKISHSLDTLNGLFDSILDISKLDSGVVKPVLESFHCEQLLERLVNNYHAVAEQSGLQLQAKLEPCVIKSDPILLERVISNLLSNAIAYTTEGSVSLSCKQDKGIISIEITDTGIGIPLDERENIFAEFYQLNNPERDKVKGLGLGLSIVQRLCKLLDHDLMLESAPTNGSKFSLTVPAGSTENVVDLFARKYSSLNIQGVKILVVDDEQVVCDAIKRALTRWGCDIHSASSIDAAAQAIEGGFDPEMIITDYRLQGATTGMDVIQMLERKLERNIPAIITTGDTSPKRLREATALGHRLLHKPVSPGLLRESIALVRATSGVEL